MMKVCILYYIEIKKSVAKWKKKNSETINFDLNVSLAR